MVALAMTDKGQLAADPEIELVGIPEKSADGEAMLDIAYDAVMRDLRNAAEAAPPRSRCGRGIDARAVRARARPELGQEAAVSTCTS